MKVLIRDLVYVPEVGRIPPGEQELDDALAQLLLERGLAYPPYSQEEKESVTEKNLPVEGVKKRR
ncbi:hypothetical protein CSW50_06800 [Thermus scotoductus]|uniref:Uncharacterized protein n=1 Tax=Thermus scotoductus TaxID=37636 RepID=A0A430R5R8_THESC|nr:hypothetical protein [Thermus scotoductus]RTH02749.1 hypothetical protein CSW50_06800 [Thermus scotoductus]